MYVYGSRMDLLRRRAQPAVATRRGCGVLLAHKHRVWRAFVGLGSHRIYIICVQLCVAPCMYLLQARSGRVYVHDFVPMLACIMALLWHEHSWHTLQARLHQLNCSCIHCAEPVVIVAGLYITC